MNTYLRFKKEPSGAMQTGTLLLMTLSLCSMNGSREAHGHWVASLKSTGTKETVDPFIDGIMARGRGTLTVKFDVASAYRNVAVHPQDRHLLGMKWLDKYYVDMAIPFGLRSAPFIFTGIADMVQWIPQH